ncbi:MAG: alpha/beta hydrolase [Paracoccaceae bacterium]
MKRFETNHGLSLAYSDEGEGPGAPLLCLAGLTRSKRDFDHFAAALPQHAGPRRIIRLDSRGRGASDHDPDFSRYNVMVEAGDAIALLDHLGVEKVVVVGTSRGGILATVIAATSPERLAGVILNDVGPVIEPDGIQRIVGYLGMRPHASTMAEAAANLAALFGPLFNGVDAIFWHEWAERSYVEAEDGLDLAYDPKLRDATLAQSAANTDDAGLWRLFESLGPIPTLLLRGANSDILSAATVAEMRVSKPDLQTAEIPDRGHTPRLDEPAALDAIAAFLRSVDG